MKERCVTPQNLKQELRCVDLPQNLPSYSLFASYEPKSEWFLKPRQALHSMHDIGHLSRVLLFQELISNKLQEEDPNLILDREAVRWAASTHDVRRKGEFELRYADHGVRAGGWVKTADFRESARVNSETLELISRVNHFHGFRSSRIPKPIPLELQILRDADFADALRIVYDGVPIFNKLPSPLIAAVSRKLNNCMNFDFSRNLLSVAEKFRALADSKPRSTQNPFIAVMNTALEVGLIKL